MRPPPTPSGPDFAGLLEGALGRLLEASCLVSQIEDHDLLAELPADDEARGRHQAAISMIAILRRELDGVATELQAAITTVDVLHRAQTRRTIG